MMSRSWRGYLAWLAERALLGPEIGLPAVGPLASILQVGGYSFQVGLF